MSILVDKTTKVICQGITGHQGTFYTEHALSSGTLMVGGVRPGKGGQRHLGLPVFNTVREAVSETGADATVIFVPPRHAAASISEAIEAEIRLIVCVTERIPVLDMVEVKLALGDSDSLLIGPNCPGIITPGECCIGIMPQEIFRKGKIGIVSRTGTLTYEAIAQTTAHNLGQSTCIGIGADPVHGLRFTDAIELFMQDPETKGVVLIGEIGGSEEEDAADYVRANKPAKPLVAYVAGRFAPAGRRMGHASAIIQHGSGGADEKLEAMASAGIHIADSPVTIWATMASVLAKSKT